MTSVINKFTEYINLKRYVMNFNCKTQCRTFVIDSTVKLHEVVIDKKELENILNLCTEQKFRVIQICRSMNNYTHQITSVNTEKSNSGNRSRCNHTDHSVHATKTAKHHHLSNLNQCYTGKQTSGDNSRIKVRPAPKSLNSHGSSSIQSLCASPHLSNSGSSKKTSASHVLNPLYLAVLERHRTTEHDELLVKQAEERTQRKVKLSHKSFDYEKQRNFRRTSGDQK